MSHEDCGFCIGASIYITRIEILKSRHVWSQQQFESCKVALESKGHMSYYILVPAPIAINNGFFGQTHLPIQSLFP